MDRSAERARGGHEPSLDPRYDPIYQRGYAPEPGDEQRPRPRAIPRLSIPRRADPAPAHKMSAAAGSAERDAAPRSAADGARGPAGATPNTYPPANPATGDPTDGMAPPDLPDDSPHQRRWAVLLAVAGVALIVVGVWAHMVAWPLQFQGWSVVNDEVRTPDGLSIVQVQLSQLAIAVAPQLIVLGVTAILADLVILTYTAARARR
ncbi:MAG TPA: hypothetical protein VIL55_01640 [Naasia sp.]|jgi:hypothetical protein